MKVEERYLNNSYLQENPDWDRQDAIWKAEKVSEILAKHGNIPKSICEVGCGSGDILVHLSKSYLDASFTGFDVSPQVTEFWKEHEKCDVKRSGRLELFLGDFHSKNKKKFDVLLLLDVFEHVRDPYTFLELTKEHSKYFVFHIPLDLSAFTVLRKNRLLETHRKVGHLHFYTKELALELLKDTGYKLIDWEYTGASLNMPNSSYKTRLARIPRKFAYFINKDFGVRLLGGETLIVFATV